MQRHVGHPLAELGGSHGQARRKGAEAPSNTVLLTFQDQCKTETSKLSKTWMPCLINASVLQGLGRGSGQASSDGAGALGGGPQRLQE